MDVVVMFKALVMGLVQGLTEFLPISSTGHLIVVGQALSMTNETAKLFEVFIQLGSILAVVWAYRAKILSLIVSFPSDGRTRRFGLGLAVAFVPAALVGLALHRSIKDYLFGPVTVAGALVIGGIVILLIERRDHSNCVSEADHVDLPTALAVGLAQITALFPGVSRSGATIMGGILAGMTRRAATEFSFFLAIPTMLAATMFDLLTHFSTLSKNDLEMLAIGFVSAFFSALWVVKWLLAFVSGHDFKPFAYYRILFGTILLALHWL
jgi:undecaprenyl-diphosphatase